jgi:hypothetical protein
MQDLVLDPQSRMLVEAVDVGQSLPLRHFEESRARQVEADVVEGADTVRDRRRA